MSFDLLNSSYYLSSDQIDSYRKNSFIKLKNVLSRDVIEYYNKIISDKVI